MRQLIGQEQPEVGDCVRYSMSTPKRVLAPRVALLLRKGRSSKTGELMFYVLRYREDDEHQPILEWWIYEHEILEIVQAPA